MHPLYFIRLTKKRLSRRENWIKGSYAKNAQGDNTAPHATDARSYCLVGAFMSNASYYGPDGLTIKDTLVNIVASRYGEEYRLYGLTYWNDHKDTKYEDVIAVLTEAERIFEEDENLRTSQGS